MFIKWIVCQVSDQQQTSFTQAQTMWRVLEDVDGFYGQWGGWNIHQPTEACIINFWRDQSSYDSFMSNIHDSIFHTNNQAQTYQGISVSLSKQILFIPGEKEYIHQALSGKWLRMAECFVKPEKVTSFIAAQQTIWNPAMTKAEGMLAGIMGQTIALPNRYQVFSFWRNEQVHRAYVKNVASLRKQAATDQDTLSVSGFLVRLEGKWLVLPKI